MEPKKELVLKLVKKYWFQDNVSFVDQVKINHLCTVSTCELFVRMKKPFACFWCRIMYNDRQPFHCPIRYHPKQVVKSFTDSFTLKGNIGETCQVHEGSVQLDVEVNHASQVESVESKNDTSDNETESENMCLQYTSKKWTESSYFEVDGCFCTASCVLAFIKENSHNPMYASSEPLLYKMMGTSEKIVESPHWKLCENYGGHLSEDQMKKAIGKDSYQQQHNIVFVNHLFEKKLF